MMHWHGEEKWNVINYTLTACLLACLLARSLLFNPTAAWIAKKESNLGNVFLLELAIFPAERWFQEDMFNDDFATCIRSETTLPVGIKRRFTRETIFQWKDFHLSKRKLVISHRSRNICCWNANRWVIISHDSFRSLLLLPKPKSIRLISYFQLVEYYVFWWFMLSQHEKEFIMYQN